jgi:hypothetical protein
MINSQKHALNCLVAVFGAMTLLPAAYSQDPSHRTVIDVPYAVQVGATVLKPGRYVIRTESPAQSSVVNVFSGDEKTLVATISGVPVFRSTEAIGAAGDKTEFWFSAPANVRPRPVRAWFYPGEEKGVEIIAAPATKKSTKST